MSSPASSNPPMLKPMALSGARGVPKPLTYLAPQPAEPIRRRDEAAGVPHGEGKHSHVVVFEHDGKSCSQVLFDLMQVVPSEGMTLRSLLHILGERGLLMACMIFCIPSLLPIPVPGMSVPQGIVIALVGLGILLNRSPFLPDRVLEYRIAHGNLAMILEKGIKLFSRIEKLSYPRLDVMTQGPALRLFNGVLLVTGALLLGAPFPIPFSNVIPAYGILFLAFGTMQRDGWLVIGGYLMLILTVLYMGLVFFFGASWIASLFG